MNYRSEGIAELHYLLNAHYHTIDSVEKAKEVAKKDYSEIAKKRRNLISGDKVPTKAYTVHYQCGPWLILDCLKTRIDNWKWNSYFEKLSEKEAIDHATILELIKAALQIDCQTFINYFEREVLDS